jgi:hypothetical protein
MPFMPLMYKMFAACIHGDTSKFNNLRLALFLLFSCRMKLSALLILISAGYGSLEGIASAPTNKRDSLHGSWIDLESAGFEARSNVFSGVKTFRATVPEVDQERSALLSDYVTLVNHGDKVVLLHCDSRLYRLSDRKSCQKLHRNSFKIIELQSCYSESTENKQPGLILNGKLGKLPTSRYGYSHFKMYDSTDNYKEYLRDCESKLASRQIASRGKQSGAPQPSRPQSKESFKAVEITPIAPLAHERSETF